MTRAQRLLKAKNIDKKNHIGPLENRNGKKNLTLKKGQQVLCNVISKARAKLFPVCIF